MNQQQVQSGLKLTTGDVVYKAKVSYLFKINKDGTERRKSITVLVKDITVYTAQVKLQKWLEQNNALLNQFEIESIIQTNYYGEIIE